MIKDSLSDILHRGLVRFRLMSEHDIDPHLLAKDSNHLHNLPDLLVNFSEKKLAYYWNIERPNFIRDIGGDDGYYTRYWERIGELIEGHQKDDMGAHGGGAGHEILQK